MLKVGEAEMRAVRQHAEEAYPQECCGVLLGSTDGEQRIVKMAVRCVNTRDDRPHDRYNIDPKALIGIQREGRERGHEILGFYHSHPDCAAMWSKTDLENAHWIGCSYVITRVDRGRAQDTRSFVLLGTVEEDKRFVEEEITICNLIIS